MDCSKVNEMVPDFVHIRLFSYKYDNYKYGKIDWYYNMYMSQTM